MASSSFLLATGGYDHTIRLWSSTDLRITFPHVDSQVNALEFTPDGSRVFAAGHSRVRSFNLSSSSNPESVFDGHAGNVTQLGFGADSNFFFTSSEDGYVKTWDTRISTSYTQDFIHGCAVTCVAIHPNQAELFAGDVDGRCIRWSLTTSECFEHLIPEPNVAVRSIAISPCGSRVALVNSAGRCYIWAHTPEGLLPYFQFVAHEMAYAIKCKFSPDGRYFATTSSDRKACVFDAHNQFELVKALHGHLGWVWDCAFSNDATYLTTVSSDAMVHVWNISSGLVERKLSGHTKAITALAFRE